MITSSCQIHFNQNMKTLYNYINEGILAGQDETMKQGDEMAAIIKRAETQLDELYSVCDNGGVSFFEIEKGVTWKYSSLQGNDLAIAVGHQLKNCFKDTDLKLRVRKRKYEKTWDIRLVKEFPTQGHPVGNDVADMKVSFDDAKTFKQLCKKILKPAFKDLDSFKKAFTINEKS